LCADCMFAFRESAFQLGPSKAIDRPQQTLPILPSILFPFDSNPKDFIIHEAGMDEQATPNPHGTTDFRRGVPVSRCGGGVPHQYHTCRCIDSEAKKKQHPRQPTLRQSKPHSETGKSTATDNPRETETGGPKPSQAMELDFGRPGSLATAPDVLPQGQPN